MVTRTTPVRQRILITGASSGLGAQMARVWAGKGRDLALCARRTADLERLRDELLTAHPERRVVVRALDVTDHQATAGVFAECAAELGGLDRVVANAGVGQGGSIGTGRAEGNRMTALTNFVGVVNQAEAALSIFREADAGHFVIISSMSALRGMGAHMNVYSASKAGVSALGEGLRSDLWDTPITVTTVHPGYIRTSLTESDPNLKIAVDVETGTAAIVEAVEREVPRAYVPRRPWVALAIPMRVLPLRVFRRMAG
jgi:hypothetical protein